MSYYCIVCNSIPLEWRASGPRVRDALYNAILRMYSTHVHVLSDHQMQYHLPVIFSYSNEHSVSSSVLLTLFSTILAFRSALSGSLIHVLHFAGVSSDFFVWDRERYCFSQTALSKMTQSQVASRSAPMAPSARSQIETFNASAQYRNTLVARYLDTLVVGSQVPKYQHSYR